MNKIILALFCTLTFLGCNWGSEKCSDCACDKGCCDTNSCSVESCSCACK